MALQYVHSQAGVRRDADMVVVDRHLYLTEDQTRVVEEGDPAGRWLWAAPGHQVLRADAERLGVVGDALLPPIASEDVREHPGTGQPMEGVEAAADGTEHELHSEDAPSEPDKPEPDAKRRKKTASNKMRDPGQDK